ncbi:MAG: hypothetical protein IPP06_04315 [Saprospiraceae bacterium]|nr:hypothetical protein [Candidatus Vicinibacter affinis]MBP6172279.1 hypothetical protein [Saprospiraceae bacterium]MBK7305190.1 hypothetical protein [Candidatus Vicinibacter affinis]MBK7693760.1 hypothetical protein [Candidatus Vicinibacter affinis]MBK7799407.1 hypothetical protein [Candidatus Vicinibacter affinis]
MTKKYMKFLIAFLFLLMVNITVFSQCPMCKMAAESNLKSGGAAGQGLNTGILYLLGLPYLIVGTMIYLYRKNRKALKN